MQVRVSARGRRSLGCRLTFAVSNPFVDKCSPFSPLFPSPPSPPPQAQSFWWASYPAPSSSLPGSFTFSAAGNSNTLNGGGGQRAAGGNNADGSSAGGKPPTLNSRQLSLDVSMADPTVLADGPVLEKVRLSLSLSLSLSCPPSSHLGLFFQIADCVCAAWSACVVLGSGSRRCHRIPRLLSQVCPCSWASMA
jgi:hypothetical protein